MERFQNKESIFTIICERATCRNFSGEPISESNMEILINAACSTASAGGFQRISMVIVKEPLKKKSLAKLSANQGFIEKAPVNVIFCIDIRRMNRIADMELSPTDPDEFIKQFWIGIVDATISVQTMALTAEGLGLRSCYNGNILDHPEKITSLLKLPEGVVPVIMLTLGYPRKQSFTLSKKYCATVMVHNEEYADMPMDELYSEHLKKFSYRYKVNESRESMLYEVMHAQKGEERSRNCIEAVRRRGWLSAYQYWFGCFYPSRNERKMNAHDYINYLKKQGFDILKNRKDDT